MAKERSKIDIKTAIKVGVTSTIRLNNIKMYRAITFNELESYVEKQGVSLVIVEYIDPNEYEQAKNFISTFLKEDEHKLIFFVANNDEYTCGIADEFALDIYLNLQDVQRFISEQYNICAYTSIDEISSNIAAMGGDVGAQVIEFSESLTEEIEIPVVISAEEDVYTYAPIDNKDDIEYTDTELGSESMDALNFQALKAETEADVLSVLHTAQREQESLQNQLKAALERISTLGSIRESLEDEVKMYKGMISEIDDNGEILEDPISIEEYNGIKIKLESIESGSSECTSEEIEQAKRTIESLMTDLDKATSELTAAQSSEKTLRSSVEQNEATISELRAYKVELDNLKEASKDIDNLYTKVTELENIEKSMAETIETFKAASALDKSSKQTLIGLLAGAIADMMHGDVALVEKFEEIQSLNAVVSKLESIKASSEEELQLLQEKNSLLSKSSEEVEKRIDLAKNFVAIELEQQKLLTVELESKLTIKEAALVAKEFQYNELVATCGTDEVGASSIRENNKTLEEVVKSLKSQISTAREELEKSKQKDQLSYRSIQTLTETNEQMRTSLKAMSAGLSAGSDSSVSMVPIKYAGKGMIIPVFGSGSFGITTTAMSIAIKLASRFRVLYIDFDMVSPKADGWFKVQPIEKMMPDFQGGGLKMSGLGSLIEKGAQYFISNSQQLVKTVISNKGGRVDYVSGIYTKYDTTKLLSTDFTSFFNFCGNSYNYVIVDLGRLGSSSINDSVIKLITDISFKNVVVTTNDKFDTRTFKVKAVGCSIAIDDDTVWVLNMCRTTKVDETTIKATSPAVRALMPFESELYGNTLDFTKERLTRDKLETIMEAVMRS